MVNFNKKELKDVADEVRDLKNWLAVAAKEYNMTPADKRKMNSSLNKIGRLLALGTL